MPTRWRATKWLDQTGGGRCAGPPQAGSAGGVQEGGRPVGRSRGGGPTGARVHACATLMYIRVNEALCGSRWRGLPLPVLLALQAVLRCRRCCAGTERSVGRVRLSRAQRPLRKCMVITGRTDGRTPDNLRVATSAKNFLSKFCAPGTSATHFFEIRATGTFLG